MADYSKINLEDANEIMSIYSMPQVIDLIPQGFGISNSNYQVKTENGKNLLLKISNDKTYHQLFGEQLILLELGKQNFPYSLVPFKTNQGNPVYQYQHYTGVLFPFIDGIVQPISSDLCYKLGEVLAKLHLVNIKTDRDLIRSHTEVGFGLKEIEEFVAHNPTCPLDFKQAFAQVFKPEELYAFHKNQFPVGLIHGDLYFDNALFRNNQIIAILDFEQSGWGEFILDIGISISGSCLSEGKLNIDLIKQFINGYQNIKLLSENELLFLDTAINIGLFSISLWRIKRFLVGHLDPQKKESYRELILRSIEYHQLKTEKK